eukprot:TRINITY_DN2246_c0_g1_i2.p1 TRINITY_DN2246_c0_g1~~TRINITY_DN2246_c0_g1_i2.p1  ORF type:complete len:688 (-),score=116.94 TRINITY_DN2246_c0_g1_i2:832-2895(-)
MKFLLGAVFAVSVLVCNIVVGADPSGIVTGSEFAMRSRIVDLQWIDPLDQVIFGRCVTGNLYRSHNAGISWEDQLSKMPDANLFNPPGSRYGIRSIYLSPSKRDQGFFLGYGTTQWRTRNKGQTYEALRNNKRFLHAVIHPTEADWILASQTSDVSCDVGSANPSLTCHIELWASRDFGTTWKLLATYVQKDSYDWAYIGLNDIPKDRIYAITSKNKQGLQHYTWGLDYNFVMIDKFGDKETIIIPKGQAFAKMDNYTFVAAIEDQKVQSIALMVDRKHTGFRRGLIPTNLDESGYSILDTSFGAAFLHVNHQSLKSDWGNLYLSNDLGTNYVLSLPFQHRNEYGSCDFEPVKGLKGIYMSNVVTSVDDTVESPNTIIQSRISFDNGGEWHFLKAPTVDSQGRPTCQDLPQFNCHLHLHGITSAFLSSDFPPFYSVPSAAGLVIATGNVGPNLFLHQDSMSIFFSSDAGLTWKEVRKGPHIYEFGDHGAIIVMASTAAATNKLVYSWDHGKTWSEYEFVKVPFDVENIITEPSATSQKFLIYGMRGSSSVVVHVDFAGLHERQCVGDENPSDPSGDYELWTPSDGERGCILGHKLYVTRRKGDAACFNGVDQEKVTVVENCQCTREDFECEYGYIETDDNKCVPDGANREPDPESRIVKTNTPPANCPSGEKYYVTSGYDFNLGHVS